MAEKPYLRRRQPKHIQVAKQNRDLAEQAVFGSPMESASIGRGGVRVYDDGNILLDGDDLKVSLEIRGGEGLIRYMPVNQAGLLADPAFWGNENVFVVAGPRRTESKAPAGYGGSNLFLNPTSAKLVAGEGAGTAGAVTVDDDGWVRLTNANAMLSMSPAGNTSFGGPGGGFQGHEDGAWSIGDPSLAVIQASALRLINVFGNGINLNGTTKVNGSLDVTGTKNFLMDHPDRPGHTIRYGATESPVSGIECRGRVSIGEDGTASVTFPDHFTAIVKPDTEVDVWLSPYGPDPAWCDEPTATGTIVHGTPGMAVAWQAKAERIGGDFTVVEEGTTEPPVPEQVTIDEPVPATPDEEPAP